MNQELELSAEDLELEFRNWFTWQDISGLWYARLRNSSPPVIVRGEDPTDLRDEIRRTLAGQT